MDLMIIAVAFGCGMLANLLRLPPLLGYLAAGFALKGMGFSHSETLITLADLGVTLLLFTIGLKLEVKT
ncbi:cation:proton antiporter, partial [Aeromonas sanarellii]